MKARLCWSLTVLNSSLTANGERRFMVAKRWPMTVEKKSKKESKEQQGQKRQELGISTMKNMKN